MSLSVGSSLEVRPVETVVSESGTGLSAEQLAEMLTNKIVYVGPDVPAAIRDQAHAFKDRVLAVSKHYVEQAQRSERTTMIGILERAGEFEAAKLLRNF